MTSNHKFGFTLIELMVVVAIMAILAIAGLSIFTTARQKAKDTRLKNDVKAWQQAVEQQYDVEAETYPASLTVADFEGNSIPSEDEITYEPSLASDTYCIYSDALNDDTAGNCIGDGGDGVCDFTDDDGAYPVFCASSVQ